MASTKPTPPADPPRFPTCAVCGSHFIHAIDCPRREERFPLGHRVRLADSVVDRPEEFDWVRPFVREAEFRQAEEDFPELRAVAAERPPTFEEWFRSFRPAVLETAEAIDADGAVQQTGARIDRRLRIAPHGDALDTDRRGDEAHEDLAIPRMLAAAQTEATLSLAAEVRALREEIAKGHLG